ncbi:MAG TPA: ATP-dependent helicase, partial [Candidatus Hydrogenedentes bacterium]|nr:ATP-dependent helicase [Candidatus Hydrogenedentota bacterium]
ITNYETVHRDLDLINHWRPDMVILDEAQRIKNWQTRRAKAVKDVESDHAIVLTGTPLENRLEELHSIMEFVDRFHLGPLFRFLDEHQHTDETGRVVGYRNLDGIKESLAPVLIRRRKQEVLRELPERTDKHFFVDMTQQQRTIHDENKDTVAQIVAKWRRWGFLSEKDQRRLMIALQYMRMACNSTYLIDKKTDHSAKMDECRLLLDDVLEIPENKVVIFSQWLGTHELLIRRFNGHAQSHAFYHGSLDHKGRKKVLERFKGDPDCRILLCTDSGGVGLNLQVASTLINMDQPWNPAVLEQRIGRVHRLGQHRSVQVYHFVSRDSIEHSMLGVLKFKSSMFAGVLDGGESEVFLGGSKMKKFMETVENVSGGIPAYAPTQEPELEAESAQVDVEETPEERAAPQPSPQAQTWDGLLAAGVEFLGQLSRTLQTRQQGSEAPGVSLGRLIGQNEKTGAPEVRIPLPDPQTAQKLGSLLSGLGEVMKSLGG